MREIISYVVRHEALKYPRRPMPTVEK